MKSEEEGKVGVEKVKEGLDDPWEDFLSDCFCLHKRYERKFSAGSWVVRRGTEKTRWEILRERKRCEIL